MSSTVAAQRQLVLHQRALEALRERIAREAYLSVREVAERLHLSREKVEALPMELLPYGDYGQGARSLRRYHPADVLAVDARLRAWRAAQARSEGAATSPVDCVEIRYNMPREDALIERCECACHDDYGAEWENDHYDSEPDSWRFNPPDRVGRDS